MKKCNNCKRTDYEHQFDKTTDNKNICLSCMNEAQNHYRKGLLSNSEIEQYYTFKEKYKEKLQEIILLCRKHAIARNEDPIAIIKEVKELENNLSLTAYDKGQGFHKATISLDKESFEGELPLTAMEHYLLVTKVLDNFDLIRENIELPKIKERDSNGRYYNWVKKNFSQRYII